MSSSDREFVTPLQEMANAMHEVFETYCAAGFNEAQALSLVIAQLQTTLQMGMEE